MEAELTKEEKNIENDLIQGLKNEGENPGSSSEVPIGPRPDFISDGVLDLVLGYKNSTIVRILGQRMGEKARLHLKELYQLTPDERSIYKRALQDFIRENFPEWEEKIAKLTNAAIAELMILELGRFHSARELIKVEADLRAKEEKKVST